MEASTLDCHVLGLQLNLVEAEEDDEEEGEEEDSFQRPKANGWVRRAGRCCGNSPYLRCKCLKELKEPEKQVSEEVCCCVGERGAGEKALNDNTGGIEIQCVHSHPVCVAFLLLSCCICLTLKGHYVGLDNRCRNSGR